MQKGAAAGITIVTGTVVASGGLAIDVGGEFSMT